MTEMVVPSGEVERALGADGPVVALETSVIAQGLPVPRNLECLERMSAGVRTAGAVPAWVGLVEGVVRVGLAEDEVRAFAEPGRALKVSRGDVPFTIASRALGASTVSTTVWAAARLGIAVAATGGIGGVHPGTLDVSADLVELSRSRVMLVCSGPKSIVDPVATAERLEELGVAIVGYRSDRLPFFLATDAGVDLDERVDDPAGAARLVQAMRLLDWGSAVLLCNPIPADRAMDATVVAAAVQECAERAAGEGVRGSALTPYLLSCLSERTRGASLEANLSLLEANARLAGEVAVAAAARSATP